MTHLFKALDGALDEIGYQWLEETHPELAAAVEQEVGRGAGAATIKRRVLARTGRLELALRCEQAARYIAANGE